MTWRTCASLRYSSARSEYSTCAVGFAAVEATGPKDCGPQSDRVLAPRVLSAVVAIGIPASGSSPRCSIPRSFMGRGEPGSAQTRSRGFFTEAGARGPARPTPMRALAAWASNPNLPQFPAPAMSEFTSTPESTRGTLYDRRDAKRTPMDAIESVGSHIARLLPGADPSTLRRLARAAPRQAFSRRHRLRAA